MSRLKNISLAAVSLHMFNLPSPTVNGVSTETTLFLAPGEDVDETLWLVTDETDLSYNASIVDYYIKNNILTRLA